MPAATTASREEFNLYNPALVALAIEEAVRGLWVPETLSWLVRRLFCIR